MIGWLTGTVREIDPSGVLLLETGGGVGYELAVSMQTLCNHPVGSRIELSVHTHVREDQISLFGFANARERALFRKLINISGIGAKTALAMLSALGGVELMRAIDRADAAAIARTPGIGLKTAQRLILELKGKLELESDEKGAADSGNKVAGDVRSALQNLGYKPAQIEAAMKTLPESDDFAALFRDALKAMK